LTYEIGSLGCVEDALNRLPDGGNMVVLYNDIFSNIDFNKMMEVHCEGREVSIKPAITLATIEGNKSLYGVFVAGTTRLMEKPRFEYNAAVAIISEAALSILPTNTNDFYKSIGKMTNSTQQFIKTYLHEGYWWDVASTKEIMEIEQSAREGKIALNGVTPKITLEK